jgi:hypothetical protein
MIRTVLLVSTGGEDIMTLRKGFKVFSIASGIIILVVLGYWFYFCVWDSSTAVLLSEEELRQKDFLRDKQAILFYSTTAPENGFNDGLSYAVFVDNQGKAKSWKMKGLEDGTMAANANQVYIEEKDKVRLVGKDYKVFPMKDTEQYTGERTGYLKKDHLFYSIYNSGFDGKGGYRSDVRWGNEAGFHAGTTIPNFIFSSGDDGEHIYVLGSNMEHTRYYLKEVHLTPQKMEIKTLADWEENMSPASDIFVGKDAFYMVFYGADSHSYVQLMRIDKKTYQREMYPLVKYANDDQTRYNLVPFDPTELYLFQNELYYIDGFGDVYTFNLTTKKVQKKFFFVGYTSSGRGYDEHLSFRGPYVYFFHFDPKTKKYLIEKYHLSSGKREAVKEITGIAEIAAEADRRGKLLGMDDFKMLEDF